MGMGMKMVKGVFGWGLSVMEGDACGGSLIGELISDLKRGRTFGMQSRFGGGYGGFGRGVAEAEDGAFSDDEKSWLA